MGFFVVKFRGVYAKILKGLNVNSHLVKPMENYVDIGCATPRGIECYKPVYFPMSFNPIRGWGRAGLPVSAGFSCGYSH